MGLFSLFQTSGRALNAYSGALGVVANNIANSSNENYSRQKVVFSTLTPDRSGNVETGRGLILSDVTQIVDSFVEARMREAEQDFGASDARSEFLAITDTIFNEFDGGGLNASMANFFDAWTGLAANPSNVTARNNVISSAESMISVFSQYASSIASVKQTINSEIQQNVPIVNNLLTEINSLNQTILETDSGALNFKDERRAALNQLSSYIDINVIESPNGSMQIYTDQGNPLLNGETQAVLSTQTNANNEIDVIYTLGSTSTTITDTIQSGRLKGLIDVRDNYIDNYKTELDRLAYAFTNEINTIHSAGFDLDGGTGNNFFTSLASATDASALISLDASIDGLPRKIAASSTALGVPGNNIQALALAALGDSTSIDFDPTAATDTNSFVGHFGDLLGDIGSDTLVVNSSKNFDESILNQVKLDRSQSSGVNIDEEEIDLIKYQAAYQASSRLVQVADQLLTNLLEILA